MIYKAPKSQKESDPFKQSSTDKNFFVVFANARMQLSREADGRLEVENGATPSPGNVEEESIWELNRVKLWRYCARLLACSTRLPHTDTLDTCSHSDDILPQSVLPPAEPERGTTELFIYYCPR